MLAQPPLSCHHTANPVPAAGHTENVMPRLMRFALFTFAAIIAIILFVVMAARLAFDPEALRNRAATALAEVTGRSVSISGPVTLGLWPRLAVDFEGLAVAPPEGFADASPLLTIGKADASLRIIPLFSRRMEFDHIRLEGLHINLVRDADGNGNWTPPTGRTITPPVPSEKDSGANPSAMPDVPRPAFSLQRLELADATLSLRDIATGESIRARDIDFVADFDAEGKAAVGLSLVLAGERPTFSTGLALDATVTPRADGSVSLELAPLAITPHSGVIPAAVGQTQLRGRLNIIPAKEGQPARLTIEGMNLTAPFMTATVDGSLSAAREASLSFALEGSPRKGLAAFGILLDTRATDALDKATAKGDVNVAGQKLQLSGMDARIDSTTFKGDVLIPLSGDTPVKGTVALGDIDIDRYLPGKDAHKMKSSGTASGPPSDQPKADAPPASSTSDKASGKPAATKDDTVLATLRKMHLDMDISCTRLSVSGFVMHDIATRLTAKAGLFTASPLQCRLYGGPTRGKASVDIRTDMPSYALTVDASGVDAGALVAALTGKRTFDAKADVKGDTRAAGTGTSDIMRTLSGRARLVARDIVLHEGDAVPKDASAAQGKTDAKRFDLLTGTFEADKGVIRNDDLVVRGPSANAEAKGIIDLPGDNIGYMATLHLKGLPDIPIRIHGRLSDPQYGVDPARMVVNTLKEAVKVIEKPAEAGGKAVQGLGDVLRNLLP